MLGQGLIWNLPHFPSVRDLGQEHSCQPTEPSRVPFFRRFPALSEPLMRILIWFSSQGTTRLSQINPPVWIFRYPCDGGLGQDAGHSRGGQLTDWHHLHPAGGWRHGGRREREERLVQPQTICCRFNGACPQNPYSRILMFNIVWTLLKVDDDDLRQHSKKRI